jgi:hypothetical protein
MPESMLAEAHCQEDRGINAELDAIYENSRYPEIYLAIGRILQTKGVYPVLGF